MSEGRSNLWRNRNREHTNELSNISYHKNKHKHTVYRKFWYIKHTYNITEEEYNKMLLLQNNKCLICDRSITELNSCLCVDHDHNTGLIRGLLCRHCNACLGWYEKYKEYIEKYLKK